MTLPWKKGQIKYVPVMYPLFKSLYGLSREESSIFLQFYIISSETKTKELFSQNANKLKYLLLMQKNIYYKNYSGCNYCHMKLIISLVCKKSLRGSCYQELPAWIKSDCDARKLVLAVFRLRSLPSPKGLHILHCLLHKWPRRMLEKGIPPRRLGRSMDSGANPKQQNLALNKEYS